MGSVAVKAEAPFHGRGSFRGPNYKRPLKTGQITDLTPAGRTCKDDGGEQRGPEKSYTILTTAQFSGTTAITLNAKTDNHTNNCVIDNNTGLMWTREYAETVGEKPGELYWDDTSAENEDIFAYCDEANVQQLAGFSDWRIPNINELLSLLIQAVSDNNSTVDSIAFPTLNLEMATYSSTTRPLSSLQALTSLHKYGSNNFETKNSIKRKCLLVRG